MENERLNLTQKDILEKQFKFDTKGYRAQEVDKFLDLIMQDYGILLARLAKKEEEVKELLEDNVRLQQENRTLKTKLDYIKDNSNTDVSNVDLLRRISSLEKIIYGKE